MGYRGCYLPHPLLTKEGSEEWKDRGMLESANREERRRGAEAQRVKRAGEKSGDSFRFLGGGAALRTKEVCGNLRNLRIIGFSEWVKAR